MPAALPSSPSLPLRAALLAALLLSSPLAAAASPDRAIDCPACADWNAPQTPFRVFGNTYYVGPHGLAVVLVDTGAGLLLFDGALPQSVAQIEANLQTLGFDIADVRWIFASHAHFDHVGGIAALARDSGAQVAAAPGAAAALRRGAVPADDPQAGPDMPAFAPVADVVAVPDGGTITLGTVTVTAVHSPGHTPGGSSWSWQSCAGDDCRTIVYADSLTAVAADGFRYSDQPDRVQAFQHTIARIGALDCDVLLTTHPPYTDLFQRQAGDGDEHRFVDPSACRRQADRAAEQLQRRLQQERGATAQ